MSEELFNVCTSVGTLKHLPIGIPRDKGRKTKNEMGKRVNVERYIGR